MGSTLDNLGSLIRMPYGCGEQNMVNFVPNIHVLRYLRAVNKQTPELEDKAKRYMQAGMHFRPSVRLAPFRNFIYSSSAHSGTRN